MCGMYANCYLRIGKLRVVMAGKSRRCSQGPSVWGSRRIKLDVTTACQPPDTLNSRGNNTRQSVQPSLIKMRLAPNLGSQPGADAMSDLFEDCGSSHFFQHLCLDAPQALKMCSSLLPSLLTNDEAA